MTNGVVVLEPVISWPRKVELGRSYLVTVDIRSAGDLKSWPYDEEQVELSCMLDVQPYFQSDVVDDPILVLHRFGGTYRPVRFVISAQRLPQHDGPTEIWLSYVNRWGVVLRAVSLPVIISSQRDITAQPSDLLAPVADRSDEAQDRRRTTNAVKGLRYLEIRFDAAGTALDYDDLQQTVAAGLVNDVFIFSHGWNSTEDSVRRLHEGMFSLLADMLGDRLESTAAVGVLWPSLLFPDDDHSVTRSPPPGRDGSVLAETLASAFPDQVDKLSRMGVLLDTQPQEAAALQEFHRLAAGLVTTPNPGGPEDAGEEVLITGDTASVLEHLAAATQYSPSAAEDVTSPFPMLWRGARVLMRSLSYYEMKNRAAVVGQEGLGPLIDALSASVGNTLRVHLIGHSFGARLVSFALPGLASYTAGEVSPVKSVMLIQGLFSHFAFAKQLPFEVSLSGALADYRTRVDGPLLATFASADLVAGWWYPALCTLEGRGAASVDALRFRWGSMGHDGYQGSGALAKVLVQPGRDYGFVSGKFYNLAADRVIKADQSPAGAHSDIQHPEIAWAALVAAGLGRPSQTG